MTAKILNQSMRLVTLLGLLGITVLTSTLEASEQERHAPLPGEIITLKVDGWTCASCEKDIYAALMKVPGVQSAQVSYASGGAIVVVQPGHVDPDQLVQAIRGASNVFDTYQATVVPNGSLLIEKDEGSLFGNFWSSLFH